MYSIKAKIFNTYFQEFFHREDSNKDNSSKGFLQRYVETLAEDMDTYVLNSLYSFIDDTTVPDKVLDKFIPYLELQLGLPVIHQDLSIRRKILISAIDIYKNKGNLKSYQLIFKAMGFDSIEISPVEILKGGFDNSIGFEDANRTFDIGKCQRCRYYTLNLNGSGVIDGAMYDAIRRALLLVDPIYVRLLSVTVNSVEVNLIDIFIHANGDLVYTAVSENNIGFTLAPNGDLIVYGEDADKYTLGDNGNIIYNEQ